MAVMKSGVMGMNRDINLLGRYTKYMLRSGRGYALSILTILIITTLTLPGITAHAQATITSAHFVIYDLANAGSTYDQELDNYLEQAYSLYTSLGMKMAPPCSGSQYTVYVVPSAQMGGEAGITYWEYTYDPSTGQIISACIKYINMSAGLFQQWLKLTAYHELVHVSQTAYWQWVQPLEAYPWYIEADAEGTAEYYLNYCPDSTGYFSNNLYEYDPYDYSGSPQMPMYYYASFIYWLIANGIGPATIEGNVFTTSTVNVPWLNNYYVQYLLSLVHGQNLCGQTYYPTFQQVTISQGQNTLSVSLQGLSAQYYELEFPGNGEVEVSVSGGTVDSNVLLNQQFYISNNTLYMAIVNPTTGSETATVTITFIPGLTVKVLNVTYSVINQELTVGLYATYGGSPVSGTMYINGVRASASNGYAMVTLNNVNWGTISLNVTYDNASATASLTLQPITAQLQLSTLYLTSNSSGYVPLTINNPNNAYIIIKLVVNPPPELYFSNSSIELTLAPGSTTVNLYFTVKGLISQGVGSVYVALSQSSGLNITFTVVPAQVNILSATYDYTSNTTTINVYVGNVGKLSYTIQGLSGTLYVNYGTYTITVLAISIPSPNITITPKSLLITPSQASLNATVTLNAQCPGYPVYYDLPFMVNGQEVVTEAFQCGVQSSFTYTFTGPYYNNEFVVGVAEQSFTIPIIQPSITVEPQVQLVAPNWVVLNATVSLVAPKCPSYPVYYEYPITINGQEITTKTFTCGQSVSAWAVLNETYFGHALSINVDGENLTTPITPPSITILGTQWLLTDNASYVNATIYVGGPYKYYILGSVVANGTVQVSGSAATGAEEVMINTGFGALQLPIPSPGITMQVVNVTLYPGLITANITVTAPSNATIIAGLRIYINGSLYEVVPVKVSNGGSTTISLTIKPRLGPGAYELNASLLNTSTPAVAYDVYVRGLSISARPLTIVGNSSVINVVMSDYPVMPLPVRIYLTGCVNKTVMVIANATLSLSFSRECSLTIVAGLANMTKSITIYWDDLNLGLTNIVGTYQGVPLVLLGPVNATAYFDNGTKVPVNVLVNGTSEFTVQSPGPVTLSLSVEYLGVGNSTYIHAYAVPSEYLYAEEVLMSLGNPQFLNETIANSIISGNWGPVGEFLNYYNETRARGYDPLAILANYLLTQYAVSGNPSYMQYTQYLVNYEVEAYLAIIAIVAVIIATALLRHSKARRKAALVLLALMTLVLTTVVAHAQQGIYVPPPSSSECATWWSNESGGYYVLYNYGDQSYSIYVFTNSSFNAWWYDDEGVYAIMEFTLNPGSQYAFNLPSGNYDIVVYPAQCGVSAPIYLFTYTHGYPVGVVSLGPVNTDQVLGYFNITSISAYNSISKPNSGVSLQLNVYLVVKLSDGTTQYYWLQDVVGFITDKDEYMVWDNVWNDTGPTSVLSDSTITGTGVGSGVYVYTSGSDHYYYGGASTMPSTYSLPFAGYLLIKFISTNPLQVQFCYSIVQNGNAYSSPSFNCYDTVTIHPYASVVNATIEAVPGIINGRVLPVDAELVFAGYASGEYTTFNSLNANLALLYWTGDAWTAFPNIYSIGVSTAETSTDLISTVMSNGFVYVTKGSLPIGGFLAQCTYVPSLPGMPTYEPQYMLDLTSPVPVYVILSNGSKYITSEFVGLIGQGINLTVNVLSMYMFSNGTRLVYTGTNESMIICSPKTLAINNFTRQYLVDITSVFPVSINGESTMNYTGWLNEGSVLVLSIPQYKYFNNDTRLAYTGQSFSVITVNEPVTMNITLSNYVRQYMVNISSLVPLTLSINGQLISNTTSFSGWINQNSTLSIYIPRYFYLGNGTRFVYLGGNESLIVDKPLSVGINDFSRQYLVSVTSQYPVNVSGALTTNYTAWLSPGTTLSIAPSTIFTNGIFMTEPGYEITINKPMSITVKWSINLTLTGALYGSITVIISVVVMLIRMMRLRGKNESS